MNRTPDVPIKMLFEVFVQVRNDLISGEINPRFFAECVMAAGKGDLAVRDVVAAKCFHRVY